MTSHPIFLPRLTVFSHLNYYAGGVKPFTTLSTVPSSANGANAFYRGPEALRPMPGFEVQITNFDRNWSQDFGSQLYLDAHALAIRTDYLAFLYPLRSEIKRPDPASTLFF